MLDKKYDYLEKEKKWQQYWQEKGTYKFDKNSKIHSVNAILKMEEIARKCRK